MKHIEPSPDQHCQGEPQSLAVQIFTLSVQAKSEGEVFSPAPSNLPNC